MPMHETGNAEEGAEVNVGLWLVVATFVIIVVIGAVIVEERSRWE
jgi:hypothetical protein